MRLSRKRSLQALPISDIATVILGLGLLASCVGQANAVPIYLDGTHPKYERLSSILIFPISDHIAAQVGCGNCSSATLIDLEPQRPS
jgi:hypothetical protein